MAKSHLAQGNDHISKLAEFYKFKDWQTLWSANSEVSAKRANSNILFKGDWYGPGDKLTIPDPKAKIVSKGTEQHHPFVVKDKNLFLRIRILKDDFTPLKDLKYMLTVDGLKKPFEGKTDGNGQLQHEVPRSAQTGSLQVRVPAKDTDPKPAGGAPAPAPAAKPLRGDVPVTWTLLIGALNPIMENAADKQCISGVQARLNNLGINTGPVDGILGTNTRAAIACFQKLFGIDPADGASDQKATQPILANIHDKPDFIDGPKPA